MKEFTIKAPAKLNFGLQVLNKRSDGYHNINTVFIKIGIYDIIYIKKADKTKISTFPDLNIPQEVNIVYKTLKKLSNHFRLPEIMNFEIKNKKNIPSGAGMGGGSSDAASLINFINDYFGLADNIDELIPLAAEIGSDVPFFLKSGDAIGKGKGEILEYFNFRLPYTILVIFPRIHISTPAAYKLLNRDKSLISESDFKKVAEKLHSNKIHIQKYVYNDFEEPVFNMHRELLIIKNEIQKSGAEFSLLTGSGSALFALFEDEAKAKSASEKFSQYRTFITSKL